MNMAMRTLLSILIGGRRHLRGHSTTRWRSTEIKSVKSLNPLTLIISRTGASARSRSRRRDHNFLCFGPKTGPGGRSRWRLYNLSLTPFGRRPVTKFIKLLSRTRHHGNGRRRPFLYNVPHKGHGRPFTFRFILGDDHTFAIFVLGVHI